ncbi:MAG: endonuclease domain-containing protein [Pirellulales bacterium]
MSQKHDMDNARNDRARALRRDATFPERLLWGRLRAGRLAGLKFRRQHPLGKYVLDFYCHAARLAIELDGDSHIGRAAYDAARADWIATQGVRILRVGNDEVLREIDSVLEGIVLHCGVNLDESARTAKQSGSRNKEKLAPSPGTPGEGEKESHSPKGSGN